MAIPSITTLRFVDSTVDGEGAVALNFHPDEPLEYEAGQHGLWLVPGGGFKPFTVASAPEESVIKLGTTVGGQSRMKRALSRLSPGDRVRFVGPLSHFSLAGTAPKVVMVAQGIGVTPFRSMLLHTALTGLSKDTTLVHVGGTHPFRADTEPTASRALYPTSREVFADILRDVVNKRPSATFMVSGAPAFVTATMAALTGQSVPTSQIRRDKFWGYTRETTHQPRPATT